MSQKENNGVAESAVPSKEQLEKMRGMLAPAAKEILSEPEKAFTKSPREIMLAKILNEKVALGWSQRQLIRYFKSNFNTTPPWHEIIPQTIAKGVQRHPNPKKR